MRIRKRRSDRCGRPPLRSPGRPTASTRSERQLFWTFIVAGMSSEAAAIGAGVSQPVGTRWFERPAVCHQRCSGSRQSRCREDTCHWRNARRSRCCSSRVIACRRSAGSSVVQPRRYRVRSGAMRRRAAVAWIIAHCRPVACRAIRPSSQGTQACRERSVALLCGGEARRRRAHQRGKAGSRARGVVEGTPARTTTGPTMSVGLEPGTDRSAPGRRLPG